MGGESGGMCNLFEMNKQIQTGKCKEWCSLIVVTQKPW